MGQDYGQINHRRLRQNNHIRDLLKETWLDHRRFIQPYFAVENLKERESIPGLIGVYRETTDSLLRQVEQDIEQGCSKMLLFGVSQSKNESEFNYQGVLQTIQKLRQTFGSQLWIAADVCLCSYTNHGHCGILNDAANCVQNHLTVKELANQALSMAQAGVDCVAPSDMMDGRIGAMRTKLNKKGFDETLIMSYSAKFHSGFYGPFRVAADSAPNQDNPLKDRATYQIDPGSYLDALNCSIRDRQEGADILMVKPGMPYLDVLYRLSKELPVPWAVYQVSGEYAAIELLAQQGLMDARRAHLESWTSFFRAGASMVISYGARQVKQFLEG